MPSYLTPREVLLRPDPRRTVMRPFGPGDATAPKPGEKSRVQRIVGRVLELSPKACAQELKTVMNSLDERHLDVEGRLQERFEELQDLGVDVSSLNGDQRLLIGAYFTEEFSFESAALFNPSVVRHPDQSGLGEGDLRIVLSLRGIGEGHVSSLTFRTGVWRADGSVEIDDASPVAVGPIIERHQDADGVRRASLDCSRSRSISETVIFPFLPEQGRGIEDVRLVDFTEDDGSTSVRGTFTAFDGSDVRQTLLQTHDFTRFDLQRVTGKLADSKGMALFPRKVNGRYAALGRQDNENVWLLYSDDLGRWDGGDVILPPKAPWEFIQMGNCGSPLEIDEGWLVLTHGVGVVRNYCMGASLLDRDDPSKVLARLANPLLEPDGKDRDGYVPNVVYSCGGLVRGRELLLPYGVADNFTAFATVDLDGLLGAMS